jgi:hypothetical protein
MRFALGLIRQSRRALPQQRSRAFVAGAGPGLDEGVAAAERGVGALEERSAAPSVGREPSPRRSTQLGDAWPATDAGEPPPRVASSERSQGAGPRAVPSEPPVDGGSSRGPIADAAPVLGAVVDEAIEAAPPVALGRDAGVDAAATLAPDSDADRAAPSARRPGPGPVPASTDTAAASGATSHRVAPGLAAPVPADRELEWLATRSFTITAPMPSEPSSGLRHARSLDVTAAGKHEALTPIEDRPMHEASAIASARRLASPASASPVVSGRDAGSEAARPVVHGRDAGVEAASPVARAPAAHIASPDADLRAASPSARAPEPGPVPASTDTAAPREWTPMLARPSAGQAAAAPVSSPSRAVDPTQDSSAPSTATRRARPSAEPPPTLHIGTIEVFVEAAKPSPPSATPDHARRGPSPWSSDLGRRFLRRF